MAAMLVVALATPTAFGDNALVFGVANKRSIAWAIAQAWAKAGARLVLNDVTPDDAGTLTAELFAATIFNNRFLYIDVPHGGCF